jgi:hypothetical protein
MDDITTNDEVKLRNNIKTFEINKSEVIEEENKKLKDENIKKKEEQANEN